MNRRGWILLGLGVLCAGSLGLALAFGARDEDPEAFAWDPVTRGEIRETLTASGEIQAKTKINVGTSVAGEIKAIHVKDGQAVAAGDLLVTIDKVRLEQQLGQAQAAEEGAGKDALRLRGAMARARDSFRRTEALHRQGLVSEEDYRQAGQAKEAAEWLSQSADAAVAQAHANVAAMRDAVDKAVLRAPIAGRVTGLKAERGETAIPGMSNLPGAVLMVISDMSEILAEIKVNESEVVRTKVGQTAQVTVESLPGQTFQGTVVEVATAAEKSGQDANLYKVKVLLDPKAPGLRDLRPGMSARAVILTAEGPSVLRVPLQAVLEREGTLEEARTRGLLAPESRLVVLVASGGRAQERRVVTGIASTQYFEVKEGLKEGDKVLTGPVRRLKDLKDRALVKLKALSDTDLARKATRGGSR